jgi:cytochrome P450
LIILASFVPFMPFFRNVAHARQRIIEYGQQRTAQYMKLVEDSPSDAQRRTLFGSLIKKSQQSSSGSNLDMGLTQQDITAESQSYITAGTDTTAATMTYLVYAVCTHPEVHEKLLRALQALPPDFTHRSLRDLPYLNCVIDETLRLYGAAQGGLPRVVPQNGFTLLGKYLPGGVKVSTQSYSIHRDGSTFPDPERRVIKKPYTWFSISSKHENVPRLTAQIDSTHHDGKNQVQQRKMPSCHLAWGREVSFTFFLSGTSVLTVKYRLHWH